MGQLGVDIIDLLLLVLNLTLLGGDGGGKVAKQLLVNDVLLAQRHGRDSKVTIDRGDFEKTFVQAT